MTSVCLFRKRGRIVGFTAEGHTGYAEEGSDIVCSAVSVLTQTALLGLTELLKLDPVWTMKDGSLSCMLPADIDRPAREKAEIILETMALGLSSICDSYGDYIKLKEREV